MADARDLPSLRLLDHPLIQDRPGHDKGRVPGIGDLGGRLFERL